MKYNNEEEYDEVTNVNFDDPLFYKHFSGKKSENYTYISKILISLAICHTIIIEKKVNG